MTTANDRMGAMFVGEHLALDFLNSVAAPKGTLIDWLQTEADLLEWLERSGLCEADELVTIQKGARAGELAVALKEIHDFRDALRDFIQIAAGQEELPLTHPVIARINEILRGGHMTAQIETSQAEDGQTTALVLRKKFELGSPRDLLTRIAEASAKLICEADFTYVRNCEGPTCTLYFLDISKNHKRRWCSMKVCGNRAKAAAHRKAKAAS
ncbi:CGNR zinc finger domain-containing protein [Thalassobius sp. S69A]|uniref:CGNR zinc finger domain-containing protein n=1 Tax=unclassified Thalassovita TaxID=2619711 RepID=UPI000C1149E7|nr:hypothetical protein [Paracoccaceae bacterium]MBT25680.1 hypothetical protein [Paracoccaceae bacterium]